MKSQKYLFVFLAIVIIGLGLWLYLRAAAIPGEKAAAAAPLPALTKTEASTPVTAPKAIAPLVAPSIPPAPPAQVTTTTIATSAKVAEPAANADPQTDLKTTLPDIARMLRDKDIVAVTRTYAPPDKLTPELLQMIQKMSDSDQRDMAEQQRTHPTSTRLDELMHPYEGQAQMLETMAEETPTLNATGDEATFAVPPGISAHIHPLVMVKIDGKWYMTELQFSKELN